MNFQKKYQSFTKAPLIGILVALIMCVGLSVQVMANPVPVQVVDDSDSSIIKANPGEAVDIYIRLDNVEEYYEDLSGYDPPFDPADPGDAEALEKLKHQIQAIQFVFTYDPSALEINEDADGNPIVEAFGVTAGSADPLLEAWPVYAKIVKDIDGNPIGELNVCLSMNPVDPSDPNWSQDLYDVEPDPYPDLTWNPSEIYSLRESGKVLRINATVDGSAAGDYPLSLAEIQDVDGNPLAILNEKDKDTGEDIIPSEVVPGTLRVGDVTPPTVISKSPDDGDTDVPVDTNITVGFSEP
ncbi:MAG: Ig-like domain-containing protein, partial [Candidatus Poribacteria bacterium]